LLPGLALAEQAPPPPPDINAQAAALDQELGACRRDEFIFHTQVIVDTKQVADLKAQVADLTAKLAAATKPTPDTAKQDAPKPPAP
jgi:BMFP domain-containing protein YqiC